MIASVRFTVSGRTAFELEVLARARLAELLDRGTDNLGDYEITMTISPKLEAYQGDVVTWEAEVEARPI